jgi:hypothetical protein
VAPPLSTRCPAAGCPERTVAGKHAPQRHLKARAIVRDAIQLPQHAGQQGQRLAVLLVFQGFEDVNEPLPLQRMIPARAAGNKPWRSRGGGGRPGARIAAASSLLLLVSLFTLLLLPRLTWVLNLAGSLAYGTQPYPAICGSTKPHLRLPPVPPHAGTTGKSTRTPDAAQRAAVDWLRDEAINAGRSRVAFQSIQDGSKRVCKACCCAAALVRGQGGVLGCSLDIGWDGLAEDAQPVQGGDRALAAGDAAKMWAGCIESMAAWHRQPMCRFSGRYLLNHRVLPRR